MATATVTATMAGEEPTEEFYATAGTLEEAISQMLDNEAKVASHEWLTAVSAFTGLYRSEAGFSFTMVDQGGPEPITYRYVFRV